MKRWLISVVFASFLAVWLGGGFLLRAAEAVKQPIEYSHQKHIKQGLECSFCHQTVDSGAVAGRPSEEVCAGCHQAALTKSPEEQKLLGYLSKGQKIPWQRLYEVPDHVYFSHARHVKAGQEKCQTCHGPMAEAAKPPSKPLVNLTMDFCIKCHEAKKVTNDCNACHR